jgi:hypothetical protein
MIAILHPTVYSPPMVLATMDFVFHMNEKEDHVVVTCPWSARNNVILLWNVDILKVVIHQGPVTNESINLLMK